MKTVEVSLIRDVRTVWFKFSESEVGSGLPHGIEAFGRREFKNLDGTRAVMVKGENGDKMPCLVAADFCRDEGYEVELIGFRL